MRTKLQFRSKASRIKWEYKIIKRKLRQLKLERFDILKDRKQDEGLDIYQIQKLQFYDKKIASVEKLLKCKII